MTVSTDPDWAHLNVEIKDFNGDSTLDVYLNILKTINNPKVIMMIQCHLRRFIDTKKRTWRHEEIFYIEIISRLIRQHLII